MAADASLVEGSTDCNELLEFYRKNSPPDYPKQLESFKAMGNAEQLELLFWLVMHLNAAVTGMLNMDEAQGESQH